MTRNTLNEQTLINTLSQALWFIEIAKRYADTEDYSLMSSGTYLIRAGKEFMNAEILIARLFKDELDYKKYIDILKQAKQKFEKRIREEDI